MTNEFPPPNQPHYQPPQPAYEVPPASTWATPPKKAPNPAVIGLVALGVVGALAGAALMLRAAAAPSVFESAVEECGVEDSAYIWMGDGGKTLTIDHEGEEEPGASLAQLACILGEVNTPDSIVARMENTRALDGAQQASWDDISASWSYHPDSGLDIVLTTN